MSSSPRATEPNGCVPNKDTVCIWFKQLEHYGFIVKVRDAHLAGVGEGESAHYRLTDRYYHGQAPTRDFEKWDGAVFENRSPVRKQGTPCPKARDISEKLELLENGNNRPERRDIKEPIDRPDLRDISRFTTGSGLPSDPEGLQDPNFNPILSWLCLRAAYQMQMHTICDEAAEAA